MSPRAPSELQVDRTRKRIIHSNFPFLRPISSCGQFDVILMYGSNDQARSPVAAAQRTSGGRVVRRAKVAGRGYT